MRYIQKFNPATINKIIEISHAIQTKRGDLKSSDFIRQHTNTVEGFSKENSWVILSELEARIKTKIETVGGR